MEQQAARYSHLPQNIRELALSHRLGSFEAEYVTGFNRRDAQGIIVGLAVIAMVSVIISGNDTSYSPLPLMGFLLGLAIVFWNVLSPIVASSWRVYVYANGFISTKGGQAEVFPLSRIQTIWIKITDHYVNGGYRGRTHVFTIERDDKRKLALTHRFRDIEILGDVLSEKISTAMLPNALADFTAGKEIIFGPLRVSTQGISRGRETLPWRRVKEPEVEKGQIKIREVGGWFAWSSHEVADFPNLLVFMTLVKTILNHPELLCTSPN